MLGELNILTLSYCYLLKHVPRFSCLLWDNDDIFEMIHEI